MADPAFALNLGGGLYIDSEGNLHQGEPPIAPIYEAPFKLPIEPKKVKDILIDVKKTLKDIDKDASLVAKFVEYGAHTDILVLLSGIGKIAGVIAPVFAVISFAFDVANLLGLFRKGVDPLEKLMRERCTILENKISWVAQQNAGFRRSDALQAVQNFRTAVSDKIDRVKNPNLTLEQLENDRADLLHAHEVHIDGFTKIFDDYLWMSSFDADAHKVIGWCKHKLVTHPQGRISSFVPVVLPGQSEPYFDHRLMVPLVSYIVTLYLSCIRGVCPEYRSTGEFRDRLISFADKIDGVVSDPTPDKVGLAQKMRHFVLARTRYEASDFQFPIPSYKVVAPAFSSTAAAVLSPRCSDWPVGAVDLRYYDDGVLMPFVTSLMNSELHGREHPTKFGALDLRWIPPARLKEGPWGTYLIDNPEECAAAANAQSEQDYAYLLAVSGYTHLVQLATLLRNEVTEPSKSQTVKTRAPHLTRTALASSQVTVKSNAIPLTGVIESSARREPQACEARVFINTQPLNQPRPVKYKIKLRTLRSIDSSGTHPYWRDADYSHYQRVQYEPDPEHPGFLELDLPEGNALDSHAVFPREQWSSTPREAALRVERTIEMRAHTFDWWIPVKSPFSIVVPFEATLAELRGYGWSDRRYAPLSDQSGMPHPPNLGPLSPWVPDGITPVRSWEYIGPSADQDWVGEHREPREEMVRIAYSLVWEKDQLRIDIKSRTSDRNYVLFVVVEEQFPRSGKVLHTAVRVPVNGQLTYIPKSFFDQEREAWDHAQKTFDYYNEKYAHHVDVGPGDPVFGWIRPGDLANPATFTRVFDLLREHRPDIIEEPRMSRSINRHRGTAT